MTGLPVNFFIFEYPFQLTYKLSANYLLFIPINFSTFQHMHSFEVKGGKKLNGEIIPQGAKNEALQIISAVLLTPEKITVTNIPDILDVNLID